MKQRALRHGRTRRAAGSLVLALVASVAPLHGFAQAPVPAAGASADYRSTLAQARAAAERRDWKDALAQYEALERMVPTNTDLLIESARVHGFADRNAEAAQRYRQVIEFAPSRRGDVLLSLAWQTLWSGQPAESEPLFVEVTQRPSAFAGGGDGFDAWRGLAEARRNAGQLEGSLQAWEQAQQLRPDDRAVARNIAQTLLWLDRYDAAIAAYAKLVASDPDDRASAYGLAQARNFSGQHREAVAEYRAAMAADRAAGRTPPEDARFDHARALRWAGYDDLAHGALDGIADPNAQWLRAFRTQREQQHWADLGLEVATDSDQLDARIASAAFGFRATATSSVEVGLRWIDLSQPIGDARGERLGLAWRARWGAGADAIGSVSDHGPVWTTLAVQANRYDDWNPLTGAARARWLPTDTLRVDAEAGREVVEMPQTIANRITVNVAGLGADWRWTPRGSVGATVSSLDFSDDNLRVRLNLRADYRVNARPKVVAGIEAMGFRSSNPTSDTHPYTGYWNPRNYREARAFVAIEHEVRPWDLSMKLGLGTSVEEDAWGTTSRGKPNLLELAAAVDLAPSLRLRIAAGGSGGSMGVAGGGEGYWRRYAGITLSGWF